MILAFLATPVIAQTTTTKISIVETERPTATKIYAFQNGPQVNTNINLSDFTDTDGLAAYGFALKYPKMLSITDADGNFIADSQVVQNGTFLTNAGKSVSCSNPYIDKDDTDGNALLISYGCFSNSLNPNGPTGSGKLASIKFTPGSTLAQGQLTFSLTELADNTIDANVITHTTNTMPIQIVKCADFNGDGFVSAPDFFGILSKFGTTDTLYDVNGDGSVSATDFFIVLALFGRTC